MYNITKTFVFFYFLFLVLYAKLRDFIHLRLQQFEAQLIEIGFFSTQLVLKEKYESLIK